MEKEYDVLGLHWEDVKGTGLIYIVSVEGCADEKAWAYVQQYGSSWGYTIWDNGVCAGGKKNGNWDFPQTLEEASKALRAYSPNPPTTKDSEV